MSLIITNFINAIVMNITVITIVNKISKTKIKIFTKRNILWLLFSILPVFLCTTYNYNLVSTCILPLFLALSLCKIFNFDIVTGVIIELYILILSVIPDLIESSFLIHYFTLEEIRETPKLMIAANTIVVILLYLIFDIPIIKKTLLKGIEKVQKKQYRRVILFLIFTFIAICIAYITAFKTFSPTSDYFASNFVIIIFLSLAFIYILEIIKYDNLLLQNDVLSDCMENVEDYQEKQDLKIHEYRNQLSKLINKTDDEDLFNSSLIYLKESGFEVLNKEMEQILNVNLIDEAKILSALKYMPKSDIKSLIYYKIIIAKKKNIDIVVDISNKINKKQFNFDKHNMIQLTQLIGIYFDNAIESATESSKKKIVFETYMINKNIVFVISNTYKGKIKLSNLPKKGVSSKGANRGKGLYFANKIINRNNNLEASSIIIGDYYIQKLIIKK